jgi:hypothetical protein
MRRLRCTGNRAVVHENCLCLPDSMRALPSRSRKRRAPSQMCHALAAGRVQHLAAAQQHLRDELPRPAK